MAPAADVRRAPEISVIIPAYNAQASISRCLDSVLEGSYRGDFEVIVADSSSDGTAEVVAERFPAVRLHRLARRAFPGDARNHAICHARGDILAFIDADCIADAHWLTEIARAHHAATPAIGGVVENANPDSLVGWASYLCKFSQWGPQTAARRMVEIPTCCLAVKRWAFDAYGPFLEGTLSSDSAFSWRLGRAGQPPLLVPSIRVAHVNPEGVATLLRDRFAHGRDFADVRVAEQRLSRARRMMLAAGCPLLPGLLFARTVARVLGRRRHRSRLLRAAPLVFLGHVAWSCGELRGYLRPRG